MSLKLGKFRNVLLAPLAIALLSTAQPGIADVPDAVHAPTPG